jgi:hypothetical protein
MDYAFNTAAKRKVLDKLWFDVSIFFNVMPTYVKFDIIIEKGFEQLGYILQFIVWLKLF